MSHPTNALIERPNDPPVALVEKTEGKYTVQTYDKKNIKGLFQTIRDKLGMEPALGEVMILSNQIYFTSKGCSRLAEIKNTKDIRFEYIDPVTFPLPIVRKTPEPYLIVVCYLTKENGGVVEGRRIMNLEDEKKWAWEKTCPHCGVYLGEKNGPYLMKTSDTQTKGLKKCSHCKGNVQGYDSWILKDYADFAETKAFMRAVGKAYNVALFDDLTEDTKRNAIDINEIITVPPEPPKQKPAPSKEPPTSPYQAAAPIELEFENPFDAEATPEAALQSQVDPKAVLEKYASDPENNENYLISADILETTPKAVKMQIKGFTDPIWVPKSVYSMEDPTKPYKIKKWFLRKQLESKPELVTA